MPDAVVTRWENALKMAFESGKVQNVDIIYDTPQGKKYYRSLLAPEFADDGEVSTVLSITRDITEQKQAEDELMVITDNMSDVVSMFDKEGKRIYVSPSCRSTGYEPEELMGKNMFELVHPDDLPGVFQAAQKAIENKTNGSNEHRIRKKDGQYVWLDVCSNFVLNDKGDIERIIFSARDISSRKQAEEELKASREELEETYQQLEKEVDKAAKIHKSILPGIIPQSEDVSFAAHYQPAENMGGDSYNIISSGNKLIFYVADVMGHGLDATMISFFIKEAIDSYIALKPENITPQELLKHLFYQYHRKSFPDDYLICIFIGVINIETMGLSYTSAGFQTLPLVLTGDGLKDKLNCSGLFISNIIPEELMNFNEYNIKLSPGTTIFISTDGLPEQEIEGEWFFQRYEEIFYENGHLPPEAILQAINKDFCLFNHNFLIGYDDVTYLVLQVNRHKKEKYHL